VLVLHDLLLKLLKCSLSGVLVAMHVGARSCGLQPRLAAFPGRMGLMLVARLAINMARGAHSYLCVALRDRMLAGPLAGIEETPIRKKRR